MMEKYNLQFKDNRAVKGRENRYHTVQVRPQAVLKSWKHSLYSFEWLDQQGKVRSLDDLSILERDKRLSIEQSLSRCESLERPVLGIGLLDNIEIGAGRDVFLTLAAQGVERIEVHIPASSTKEFETYIAS